MHVIWDRSDRKKPARDVAYMHTFKTARGNDLNIMRFAVLCKELLIPVACNHQINAMCAFFCFATPMRTCGIEIAQPGVTVLDIGTGTGILAVMAARAGASHVFACEVNGVLCDIARDVLDRSVQTMSRNEPFLHMIHTQEASKVLHGKCDTRPLQAAPAKVKSFYYTCASPVSWCGIIPAVDPAHTRLCFAYTLT